MPNDTPEPRRSFPVGTLVLLPVILIGTEKFERSSVIAESELAGFSFSIFSFSPTPDFTVLQHSAGFGSQAKMLSFFTAQERVGGSAKAQYAPV